jgi:hypothetical protein
LRDAARRLVLTYAEKYEDDLHLDVGRIDPRVFAVRVPWPTPTDPSHELLVPGANQCTEIVARHDVVLRRGAADVDQDHGPDGALDVRVDVRYLPGALS